MTRAVTAPSRRAQRGPREHLRHLERVFWIDREVRAGRYPNAGDISRHFEVNEKTALRTIEFMRSRFHAPLDYSPERRGFFYSEPTFALPAVLLTEGDLLTLVLATRLVREYRGSAIGGVIEETFAKIMDAMTDQISVDLNLLANGYSFEALPVSYLDVNVIRRLGKAILEKRTVRMVYYTASRGATTERLVDPIHLRNYAGEWYLIAFDHNRRQVRDFNASRIRELDLMDRRFRLPDGFDLSNYLESGFQMIRGGRRYEVELIFDEYQARYIRERPGYHPSEHREELPGGELRLRMTVSELDPVLRFVLQYGSHVRVEGPEDLRSLLRRDIERLGAMY